MGKGKGLTFTIFAALGALAGYATYMASKDEFSDETKDRYDKVVNKVKNVGTDLKRTYTSIGDKESFNTSTKNLGNSAMKLVEKAGNLVASASSDMYKFASSQISKAIEQSCTTSDDDINGSNDDLDVNYVSTKGGKKKKSKSTTKKSTKATTKKSNSKSKK